MKKLFAVLAVAMLSIVSAYAADYTWTYKAPTRNAFPVDGDGKKTGSIRAAGKYFHYSITGFGATNTCTDDGLCFGSRDNYITSLTLYSDDFSEKTINKIIIQTRATTGAELTVKVGETDFLCNGVPVANPNGPIAPYTFTGVGCGRIELKWLNDYYKGDTNRKTGTIVYLTSITIEYSDPVPATMPTATVLGSDNPESVTFTSPNADRISVTSYNLDGSTREAVVTQGNSATAVIDRRNRRFAVVAMRDGCPGNGASAILEVHYPAGGLTYPVTFEPSPATFADGTPATDAVTVDGYLREDGYIIYETRDIKNVSGEIRVTLDGVPMAAHRQQALSEAEYQSNHSAANGINGTLTCDGVHTPHVFAYNNGYFDLVPADHPDAVMLSTNGDPNHWTDAQHHASPLMLVALKPFEHAMFHISSDSNTLTSVGNMTDASAPAPEYYNLQGIRVDNPSGGIFIRRQGSVVTKIAM